VTCKVFNNIHISYNDQYAKMLVPARNIF